MFLLVDKTEKNTREKVNIIRIKLCAGYMYDIHGFQGIKDKLNE